MRACQLVTPAFAGKKGLTDGIRRRACAPPGSAVDALLAIGGACSVTSQLGLADEPPVEGRTAMKIRLIVLTSLVAGLFAAFGPASAMAESTQLCSTDTEPCANPITHLHPTGSSTLLTNVLNVECNTLFLGSSGALGSQQPLEGSFTFSSCSNGCEANELEEESPGEVERSGHELGWWHFYIRILWRCGFFFHCTFRFRIWMHYRGPLLASLSNGEFTVSEEEVERESGFCPEQAYFDATLTPLSATYIKS